MNESPDREAPYVEEFPETASPFNGVVRETGAPPEHASPRIEVATGSGAILAFASR